MHARGAKRLKRRWRIEGRHLDGERREPLKVFARGLAALRDDEARDWLRRKS